jgi:hypothetical protein
MADRYAFGQNGTAGSSDPADNTNIIIALQQPASPVTRGYVYDLVWGTSSGAADNQIKYQVQRLTSITGDETVFPVPLDPGAPAHSASHIDGVFDKTADAGVDITAATLTADAFLLWLAANQRSTQRWVSSPGGELVIPATAHNGLAFNAIHGTAIEVEATFHFYQ